jgi:glycosyltransferase involved in cell wall biosynthesis
MPAEPMRPINLLYVIQSLNNGGAETLGIRLAAGLDKTRFTATVCSLCDEGPLRGVLEAKGVAHVTLGKKDGLDWSLARRIRSVLRSHDIDIVHTHNKGPLLYTRLATLFSRNLAFVHTEHINMEKELSYSRKHDLLDRFLFRGIDGFLSIAEHLSEYYQTRYNLARVKFTTIHNSVTLPEPPKTPLTALRRELGIRDDQPLIGNISALRRQKDHATLLRAMPMVLERLPNAVLAVAGDGELKQELADLARNLGLENNVRFLGYRSDVNDLLSQFDVFVLPSLYEGLPLCILEAMAAAAPVVATNADGTNEVVRHGETGLLVPVQDPPALAQAMLTLLEDRPRARAMGQAAREVIRTEYNMDAMISRYEAFYEQLLQGRKSSVSRPLR